VYWLMSMNKEKVSSYNLNEYSLGKKTGRFCEFQRL